MSINHPVSAAREQWEGPPQWAPSPFLPWRFGQGTAGGAGLWAAITLPLRSSRPISAGALAQICSAQEYFPEARENKTCVTEQLDRCWAARPERLGLCSLDGLFFCSPLPGPGPSFGFGSGLGPLSFSGYFKILGQGDRNSDLQGAITPKAMKRIWLPWKTLFSSDKHTLSFSLSLLLSQSKQTKLETGLVPCRARCDGLDLSSWISRRCPQVRPRGRGPPYCSSGCLAMTTHTHTHTHTHVSQPSSGVG